MPLVDYVPDLISQVAAILSTMALGFMVSTIIIHMLAHI